MARKPREEWGAIYLRRIQAGEARYGSIFEGDQKALRQKMRGHKPREHVTRRENIISAGRFPTSSADYNFLAKQRARSPAAMNRVIGMRGDGSPIIISETPDQRFERARTAYLKLAPAERKEVRAKQQGMERRYRGFKVRQSRVPQSIHGERNLLDSQYGDSDYYDLYLDYDNDISSLYFYH